MSSDRFAEIRELQLFRDISDDSFETLTRGAYVQNFPPHTELITEGDPADFLYIITSGAVDLFASWEGRESSMAIAQPVSTFILAATINERPFLMSGRTLNKCRIILIPSEDVRTVFETDPAFARAIVTELAIVYRATSKSAKNLKLRTSLERLANHLVTRYRENDDNPEFELKFEKRLLASLLGMTPENLSRSFNALKQYGVVVDGQKVHLTDINALIAFARPAPLIDG